RVALEDSPALELRLDELVHEARLAHARLADDRHDLAVAGPGQPSGALQLLQLHVATDETREAAPRCGLELRAGRPGPRQLVDVDRTGHPIHGDQSERLH